MLLLCNVPQFGENFTEEKSVSDSVPDLNSLCWDYWESSEQEQKAQVSAPRLHQKLWAAPLCLWGRWEAELWQGGCPSGEMSLREVSQSAHRMPGAHSLWDPVPCPLTAGRGGEQGALGFLLPLCHPLPLQMAGAQLS